MSCGRVVFYGGCGGLGSACVDYFKRLGYWVCSIDFHENANADVNIVITDVQCSISQEVSIVRKLGEVLNTEKVNGVFCVAGGWAGGNTQNIDFLKNCDLMWKKSVWPSCVSASLASKYISNDGLLVLSGADAALRATPGMIGYGMAKAAVHHLTKSLAEPNSGIPPGVLVTAIAPVILDTPMNRKWMSTADKSTWTPLEDVARLFNDWLEGKNHPKRGTINQLISKDGVTECIPV